MVTPFLLYKKTKTVVLPYSFSNFDRWVIISTCTIQSGYSPSLTVIFK